MKMKSKSKNLLLATGVAVIALSGMNPTNASAAGNDAEKTLMVKSLNTDGKLILPKVVPDKKLTEKQKKAFLENQKKIDTIRSEILDYSKTTGKWNTYYAFEYVYTPGFFEVTVAKDAVSNKTIYLYDKNKIYYGSLLKNQLEESKGKGTKAIRDNIQLFKEAPGPVPLVKGLNDTKELAKKHGVPQVAKDYKTSKLNNPDLLNGTVPTGKILKDPAVVKTIENKMKALNVVKVKTKSIETISSEVNTSESKAEFTSKQTPVKPSTKVFATPDSITASTNEVVKYDLSKYFANSENSEFEIKVNGEPAKDFTKADVVVSNNSLKFSSSNVGEYIVNLTSSSGATKDFKIVVNKQVKTKTLKDIITKKGDTDIVINLDNYFANADEEEFTYDFKIDGPYENIGLSDDKKVLTLHSKKVAENTITITATGNYLSNETKTFRFSVLEPEKEEVKKDPPVKEPVKEVKKEEPKETLPQTGESTGLTTAAGLGLLGIASFLGIRRKQKK